MVKEIDMQVQEAQRISNKMNPNRPTTRHVIIKMPKVKEKERILRAAREMQVPTKEFPYDYQLISQKKFFKLEGTGKKYSK